MTKIDKYRLLLKKRRADLTCYDYGCVNAWHEDGDLRRYDEAHNLVDPIDNPEGLDARILILGQDFGDANSVRRAAIAGRWQNTDHFGPRLTRIKKALGIEGDTFTSNLVPFFKNENMSAPLKSGLVKHCAKHYARELISIVGPKVVYLLGAVVTHAMFREYGLVAEGSFNDIVDAPARRVHEGPWMVPVSHPGGLGWGNRRLAQGVSDRTTQHLNDWRRVPVSST